MGLRGSDIVISLCLVLAELCSSHPHGHRERHHLKRAHRSHQQLCPLVQTALPTDYPISERQFTLVKQDIQTLLQKLACRIDQSCDQQMLNDIPMKTSHYDLSQTDYSDFIKQMLRYMRNFYDEFDVVVSRLNALQSSLILDSSDPLVRYSQLLTNDLQELMCYLHRSTAVRVPGSQDGVIAHYHTNVGDILMKYIPLMRNFQEFILKCMEEVNRRH